jgi:N,N'-diacetyllegionaminate synthase
MDIVAELAQGFEGRPEQARLLLRAAASAGADAAKYQLVYADELAVPAYEHYALFKSLEMDDAVWAGVAALARELGIALQFDIFGARSLALAEALGVSAVKLHPTDVANEGLLALVAASSVQQVLIGAGGCLAAELKRALQVLSGKRTVVLLGFQAYPTPDETNQIARVRLLAERLKAANSSVEIGFADHATPGGPLQYALSAVAVGAGATIIEKHLTLARVMTLEDHESALTPDEFAEFVRVMRACADSLGEATAADDFGMSGAEHGYRVKIRRHVVAGRPLAAGAVIGPEDVVLKRTAEPGALTDLREAYGRTLTRELAAESAISMADFVPGQLS